MGAGRSEMEGVAVMDASVLRGKRVLITGHTGFKGAWLALWCEKLGASITGIALDPVSERGVFGTSGIGIRIRDLRCDIRDRDRLMELFKEERPEVVFHLAARSLVLESYRMPVSTFDVNVMGTIHVLEAIRQTPSVRAAVMVTTDKCYENHGRREPYAETDPLGGHDPYSASKGAAEIVIASYRRSFFSGSGAAGIASARSGNVIGGGDWSEDRIVPDFFRALEADRPLRIRNPDAVRPWQHVLEPLHGYLLLAAHLMGEPARFAGAWNFGPSADQMHSVRDVAEALITITGQGSWETTPASAHEADLLMLDSGKAAAQLGWRPRLSFAQAMELTAEGYLHDNTDIAASYRSQIEHFERLGHT